MKTMYIVQRVIENASMRQIDCVSGIFSTLKKAENKVLKWLGENWTGEGKLKAEGCQRKERLEYWGEDGDKLVKITPYALNNNSIKFEIIEMKVDNDYGN